METAIERIEPTTIFFTEEERGTITDFLAEEIEDLETGTVSATDKRMIKNRKDKILELDKQKMTLMSKECHFDKDGNSIGAERSIDLLEKMFSDRTVGTAQTGGLIFLTHRFKSGHFLGFWSEHPWGLCSDQDKGWAVINPDTMEVIDQCETRSGGIWCGDFREWERTLKPRFGKKTILHDGMNTSKPSWKNED